MSKKHGAKRKHRKARARKRAVLCASCLKTLDGPTLLAGIAAALNACADAGVWVKFGHGIVATGHGYVLDTPDGRWKTGPQLYGPLYPVPAGDDVAEMDL